MSSDVCHGAGKLFEKLSVASLSQRQVFHLKKMLSKDCEGIALTTSLGYGMIGWMGTSIFRSTINSKREPRLATMFSETSTDDVQASLAEFLERG